MPIPRSPHVPFFTLHARCMVIFLRDVRKFQKAPPPYSSPLIEPLPTTFLFPVPALCSTSTYSHHPASTAANTLRSASPRWIPFVHVHAEPLVHVHYPGPCRCITSTDVLHVLLNHHALVEPRLRSTYPLTHRHVVLPLVPVHPHLHGHGSSSSGRLKVLGTLERRGRGGNGRGGDRGENVFGDDEDVGKNATRMSVSASTSQRTPVIASTHPLLLRSPSFLSLILDTRFPALRA
ncbi:hypothetical protein Hypma_004243 [Hypsizygus marmoreus]|uniref:Uncharacterized protein n=1 Tax=Hypsizygus marmoreus TaxID=39966 RepID=A0A369J4H4_HYPMA|nr:hypothetical protein Hypma_004243 [Hypsizygus marmoreus]